ncbi:hypothetical protein FNH08_10260 [Streptomyces spongiae]|uniref:Transposase n=1 Tax=Streptomyces spongiae TaxID=565072 RepID=A0A5N8XF09_9ACTN|nr:hypothetical protein [Streptomyces spongiae]
MITEEPGDSESVKPGSAGGREEKELPRQTPRRAADPTSWLPGYRGLSPRYERNPRNHLAFLGLAAALCCYKRLVRLTT